jgi:Protein of unknown function (DUF1656)
MIREVDIYGVFVSPLLLWAVMSLPVVALLRRVLARAGFYRLVWHRPLFDLALLIMVLGGMVAVTSRWFTL